MMIGYILVWLGTMLSMSIGYVFGKTWLDRKFTKKPPQGGGTTV